MNGTLVPGLIRVEVGDLHPNWESPGLKQRVSHRIVLPAPKNRPAIYRQPHVASMFGDVLLFNDAPPVLIDDRNQTLIDFRSEAPTTPVHMASNLSADGKRLLVAKGLSGSQGEHDIELRLFDVDSKREICKCNVTYPSELSNVVPHPREDVALLITQDGAYSLIDVKNGNQIGRFTMPGFHSENCLFVDQGRKILGYWRSRKTLILRDTQSLDAIKEIHVELPIEGVQTLPDDQNVLIIQSFLDGVGYVTKYDVKNGRRVWSHAGRIGTIGQFSKNGRWYLSGSRSWSLWDLETPQEKVNIEFPDSMEIQNGSVADDGTVRLKQDNSILWKPE